MEIIDRYRGCLGGLAIGDALGTTLEFTRNPEPIDDLVGGGPFRLAPGEWTDDTSMALSLAASLVARRGFDATDQCERYVRWWRDGEMSVTGRCFDIGVTTARALGAFEHTLDPMSGPSGEHDAGNGSLMRLAPVPMAFAHDPEAAIRWAGESSRTTHGATEAVDACRYYAGLVVGALRGEARETLLSPAWSPVDGRWKEGALAPRVRAIAEGSFKHKARSQILSGGYVIESLEAALWGFHHAQDFRGGALAVVNLGHDADTCGAIYGMLAGAWFGWSGIPQGWRDKLAWRDTILGLADQLLALSTRAEA
jgi:ADP-ribosylglycohydrolase